MFLVPEQQTKISKSAVTKHCHIENSCSKTASVRLQASGLRQDKCKSWASLSRAHPSGPRVKGVGQVSRDLSITTPAGIGQGRRVRHRQLFTHPGEQTRLATVPHVYTSFNGEEGLGSGRPWPAESECPYVIRMLQRTTSIWIWISSNESQATSRLIQIHLKTQLFLFVLAFRPQGHHSYPAKTELFEDALSIDSISKSKWAYTHDSVDCFQIPFWVFTMAHV